MSPRSNRTPVLGQRSTLWKHNSSIILCSKLEWHWSADTSTAWMFNIKDTQVVYHLPKKARKFRMECKWKDEFCLPERKFSRKNGISWKVVQNSQTEFPNGNVLTICHSKPVPGHTPFFICVTWDESTWLLLRVLFSSVQELRSWFWSFESTIWTQRLRKTAPQPHKNQQFSSDLSSWKLRWLILSAILHRPHNREAARSNYSPTEASIISLNTTISAAILKMSKSP